MRGSPKERGVINHDYDDSSYEKYDKKADVHWYDGLDFKKIEDILPVIRKKERDAERIQIPVSSSTVLMANKIREKHPEKFRINLDVYRSMLYAGRQLFDEVYLKHAHKDSKSYKLAKIMESIDETIYTQVFVEELLEKLLEGYLSQGQGQFSRDKILAKIDEIKPLLTPDLVARCDNFIDDELDSPIIQARIKERLRKRAYRENKKKNNVLFMTWVLVY